MKLLCTYIIIYLKILITNEEQTKNDIQIDITTDNVKIRCRNTKVLNVTVFDSGNHSTVTNLKLKKCSLPNNVFRNIVSRFNLINLENIRIDSVHTMNNTLKGEEFVGLSKLKELDLLDSDIRSIKGPICMNIPNLYALSLYGNNVSYIPKNTFKGSTKLIHLHLKNNNIESFESGAFDGLENLKYLELSYNKIQFIEEDTLKELINLVHIDLSRNKLKRISRNMFKYCKNTETINIEGNSNVTLIDDVFSNFVNLTKVNLSNNLLKNISETLFDGSVKLQVIHLNSNSLISLEKNVFGGLESLEKLYLNDNEIQTLHPATFSSLKNLKQLYLQHNRISRIEEKLFGNLQNLIKLNLSFNKRIFIHPNSLINNIELKVFLMTNSEFNFESVDIRDIFFKFNRSIHLRRVDLSYNNISTYPYPVSYLQEIENINLRHNSIRSIQLLSLLSNKSSNDIDLYINLDLNNISTIEIHPDHLNTSRKSKTFVTITGNPIICDCNALNLARFLQEDHILKEYISFEPVNVQCSEIVNGNTRMLNNMELADLTCALEKNYTKNGDCDCLYRSVDDSLIVDCSKRELTDVPELYPNRLSEFKQTEVHLEGNRLKRSPEESDGYANITKLFLQENEITNVTWLPSTLKVLNLSNNSLCSISDETLKILNESSIRSLRLGFNPWRCDCGTSGFAEYLRKHIEHIDLSDIRCESTKKKLVDLSKKDLCPTKLELILILSLSVLTLFFLVTITTSVYFKYKKEILIWLYSRGLCLCLVKEDEIDEDKIYDAFISYSHKDEEFVTDNIISVLESGEQPYKLCVHVRDFIPGELIHSQILKSVRSSRRTIVILSSSFLESVWGKLEFKTAHTEAMIEGRARVIIIIYGDIDLKSLDDDLKAYIKTNTYVEWGDPWFWKKLRYALPKRSRRSLITSQNHANRMQIINNKFRLKRQDWTSKTMNTLPKISDSIEEEERRFTYIA